MKTRVKKGNKQAELEDPFCASWSGFDNGNIKVQLLPESADMKGKRNLFKTKQ